MLLFAESIVEIRNIETGRLVQLLPVPAKLTWEKQGGVDTGSGFRDNRDYKLHVALARSQNEDSSSQLGAGPGQWSSMSGHTLYRMKASEGR